VHGPDEQRIRTVLERARANIVAAVHGWRASGGKDDDMALVVDANRPGVPRVSAADRGKLKLTIPDFDPTIAIEFAKNVPGQAPAVVDVAGLVRRVVWIDLTPPYTW
jgi:hypothetical protein